MTLPPSSTNGRSIADSRARIATIVVFFIGCLAVVADSCEQLPPQSIETIALAIQLDEDHPTASIPFEIVSSTLLATHVNLNAHLAPTPISDLPITFSASIRPFDDPDSTAEPLAAVQVDVAAGEDPNDADNANTDVEVCATQPCTYRFVLLLELDSVPTSSVSVNVDIQARVDLDDQEPTVFSDYQSTEIILGEDGTLP
ncbi:MAG: hypothetical protein Q8O67_28975 [Deltaproteobacteria bacterium]|nr:hypothetical protein [Deltaproteobacteria bacterium]